MGSRPEIDSPLYRSTSRTIPFAQSFKSRQGFTLLEILAVLFLVSVVFGIAVAFVSTPSTGVKGFVYKLTSDVSATHSKAIKEGKVFRMSFNLDKFKYKIEEFEMPKPKPKDDPETEEDRKALEEWEESERAIDALSAEDRSARTRIQRGSFKMIIEREIPDNLSVKRFQVGSDPTEKPAREGSALFYPSGESDQVLMVVADSQDRTMSIMIHPVSGRVLIRKGDVKPEEALSVFSKPQD